MLITFCADQSLCCNYPNQKCCSQGGGVWIQDGAIVTTSPSPASQTSHSPSNSTSTPTSTPASNPYKLALEISLPVLFFVFLLSLSFYFYIHRTAHKRSISPLQENLQEESQPQGEIGDLHEMDATPSDEVSGNAREMEADVTTRIGWRRLVCF